MLKKINRRMQWIAGVVNPALPGEYFLECSICGDASGTCVHVCEVTSQKRCSYCNKLKDDVELLIDPYKSEINGDDTPEMLCGECYHALLEEI